ncbi:hypothetical protein NP233_g12165 [Leucocoprinus birnbaumii]|uniref:Uncharacterized protein n=1 Tax=Leucocoprinus birnbaumii TaxID=56174 RepID=A0AAD5VKN3_9AGAR|nr:hypothetical protein NP233_g12165 [Leucocoprinus birnbaumii]
MQNLYQEDERNTPQDAADPTSQSTRLGEPATVEKPQAHSHSLSGPGGWIGRTKTMLQNDTYQRPLLIALGPLPILCFVWGVFVVSYIRPIPLPDHLAVMVSTYPQSATVIAAITATILSSLTSFFFSLAARYLISIHLVAKSTPLEVLTSVTHIAQRVLWLHDPRFEWTWIVFLAFLSTNLQTPWYGDGIEALDPALLMSHSLTSFFNVRRVRIDDPINGYDLDMTDPQLIQISNNTQLGPVYNAIASFFLQNVMVYAMRLVQRNIPTTFYFNNYTYVSTTGGIHPATYVPNYNEEFTMNFTTSLPPNLKDLNMKDHIRLPFNKTMSLVQQGFTAEVDCRVGNSKAIMVYNATLDVVSMGMGLSAVKLQANCPGNTPVVSAPVVYNTSDTINSGGILGVTCQIPGTDSLEVIIRSSGAYGLLDFTTCTVSPKTTLVNVVYTTSAKITDVPMTINVSEPIAAASAPIWGKLAIDMLMFNINLAQGIQENTVGNAWLLTGVASREITLDESMNVYIRASIEFIGTVRLISVHSALSIRLRQSVKFGPCPVQQLSLLIQATALSSLPSAAPSA